MGIFNIEFLQTFMKEYDFPNTAIIETGTLHADSTFEMSKYFKEVYTIEINYDLYKKAFEKYVLTHNMNFIYGDSADMLHILCKKIKSECIFYLDAHWSGDSTVNWKDSLWCGYGINTGYRNGDSTKPENQVPLEEEFKIIANEFPYEAIIYVDDMDKFDVNGQGTKDKCFIGENWSHLNFNKLLAILGERLLTYKLEKDQLLILLRDR